MEPAVRTRIHIVTGPYFDVPDVVHDGTDCKMCYYYYENFSVPRTGSVLEAPLGYWSAHAEDWPISTSSLDVHRTGLCRTSSDVIHVKRTIPRRSFKQRNSCRKSGAYKCFSMTYNRALNPIAALCRITIDRCHLTQDEIALLRQLRPDPPVKSDEGRQA